MLCASGLMISRNEVTDSGEGRAPVASPPGA
jgi:hypothetical protein